MSVTMMLLNIVVVSVPSKLIISLNQQFGICYLLPSLFVHALHVIHCCEGVRVCSSRALGGLYIWKCSSLRIVFLKKKIGKEDYFTISCIYNLPVVDARDYLIQCLGVVFFFF